MSTINYALEPDTVRFLPQGVIKLSLGLSFHSNGVLDLNELFNQFLSGVEAHLGKIKSINQLDRENLERQLVQGVIENNIQSIDNVLDDFIGDGEPFRDSEGEWHIPLSMKGNGYKMDFTVKYLPDGAFDLERLVDSLESAYIDVMSGSRL